MENIFGNKEKSKPSASNTNKPLADRLRPTRINQIIGQIHLLSNNSPLFKIISRGHLPSLIFWGPPGCGKTTLAQCLANEIDAQFYRISAVESGVKDLREIILKAEANAKFNKKTILFIDEIHRFNKSQQDALLHSVESGLITLIGATTENPSFEVNSALLSRTQTFKLNPLKEEEIKEVIVRAIKEDEILANYEIEIENFAIFYELSAGDARVALNILENSIRLASNDDNKIILDKETIVSAAQRKVIQYDKNGENHYDTISAFIKSLRGSDPDAALLWMAKMLEAGEDPKFIARRMVIFASEDIGNAEPMALSVAINVFNAVQIIGMPEAALNLAQGVTFLAGCPKSNASCTALMSVQQSVKDNPNLLPPLHLRNAPTNLMKQEGYSKDYKYPHSFPENFVDENYFPINYKPTQFYFPSENGKEKQIKEFLKYNWKDKKKY